MNNPELAFSSGNRVGRSIIPFTMLTGTLFDIRKFSTRDGPGIRTTIFFCGCPLDCWWCHNPESQSLAPQIMLRPNRCVRCGACIEACPQGAIAEVNGQMLTDMEKCTRCGACASVCYSEARQVVSRSMTVAEVLAEVQRDQPFYDESGGGVTFSGGEPLMQPDFLLALLRACRAQGIHTALDTCGFAAWEVIDKLRHDVDLFLYDIKLMNDERHQLYTGVSNRIILENLHRLAGLGQRITLRLPLIPGINDSEDDLRAVAGLALNLPGAPRLDVLPYHNSAMEKYRRLNRPYRMEDERPHSETRLEEIITRLQGWGVEAHSG